MSHLFSRYIDWNGTSIAYPNKTLSSPQNIYTWTRNQMGSNFVTWIGASGRKSLNLAKRLETGSQNSLIVFANRPHGLVYNKEIHMIQEIALQYLTCDDFDESSGHQFDSNHLRQRVHDLHRGIFASQDATMEECLKVSHPI